MAKTERQKAVAYADKMFSLFIRKRDKKCYCGKPTQQCGHLISRASYSTRWDEMNANGSCSGCNMAHEYRPEDFTNWWIKKHGTKAYDMLVAKGHSVFKISNSDLYLLGDEFKRKAEELP
jgi:5-methylcytosine-specific restriction endonuclease McrA